MTDLTELRDYFSRYTTIEENGVEEFVSRSKLNEYAKGKFVIEAGQKPANLLLVLHGCLMTYYLDQDANPHVLQFGTEFWWTGDLEAFTNGGKSIYSIKTIVDTTVMELDLEDFEYICRSFPSFEKLFRKIFQNALVSHQKRIMENISSSAESRYRSFQQNYPKIELMVPQKYIASYLGITPEFLSKMRSKK